MKFNRKIENINPHLLMRAFVKFANYGEYVDYDNGWGNEIRTIKSPLGIISIIKQWDTEWLRST